MKFGCLSCGAKYSVPDGRLEAAGSQGLRIRFSRCRAIMVVSESQRAVAGVASPDDEDTRKDLPLKRPRPATISSDSLASSSVSSSSESEGDVPAALSASGVFRPLPGVNRQVTGLFFPELEELRAHGKNVSSRVWYAAVGGRPRGPFAATEMVALAEKGKIRESTLVWRPGFATWLQVRHPSASLGGVDDLSWLAKIVRARKVREREAQTKAEQRLGIKPVSLTRTTSGRRPSALTGTLSGAGLPPPVPLDDDDQPQNDPLESAPALASASFLWRADDDSAASMPMPGATLVRRRQTSTLALLSLIAVVVAVAASALFALKSHAFAHLVSLLWP